MYSNTCNSQKTLKHYQTIIVGGGIVGAGIFRDLALQGINCLLVEKGDFSSQTSQKSSKMLHGGIRYLENLDFKLVFEALEEKNLWIKLAPHLAREMPLALPVYKNSKRPLWMIHLGLLLYDLLSKFKNSPYKILNREQTLKTIPFLNPDQLVGAGVYYDGIMDDAKITLEVIYDAAKLPNAEALNYTEVIEVKTVEGKNFLTTKNCITHELETFSCDQIVYSLGPYTDVFLKTIPQYNWKDILLPSKGSHIWISKNDLPLENPLVMTMNDNRIIFVIPHDDKILVGTTEIESDQDLDHLSPNQQEIDYLLNALKSYFPNLIINQDKILSSFSGVRPLIQEEGNDRGKTSREHKIYQPLSNTYVIAGGKYTTFRVMGQEISREICHKHGISYIQDKSLMPLKQKSIIAPFQWHLPSDEELELICRTEFPKTFEDLVVRRLSISSRSLWLTRVPSIDFNKYFKDRLDIMNKFFHVSEKDIVNFN